MSKLGIMTTILATKLCDAFTKDEQGDGLDLSAGLYGDETTKFIKDIALQLVEVADLNVDNNPAVAAIAYAIDCETDEGLEFLKLWNEGEFQLLRDNWDNIPDKVFIGAEPFFKPTESDLTCYECGKPTTWLAPDSRCGDCTLYTPEEIRGEYC